MDAAAQVADVVKEDHAGDAVRIGGFAEQGADHGIVATWFMDTGSSYTVVLVTHQVSTFRQIALVESFDFIGKFGDNPCWFASCV